MDRIDGASFIAFAERGFQVETRRGSFVVELQSDTVGDGAVRSRFAKARRIWLLGAIVDVRIGDDFLS